MFYQYLSNINPYGTATYDKFMNSVSGSAYQGDETMVATLRALLFERLNGKPLHYEYRNDPNEWHKRKTAPAIFRAVFGHDTSDENHFVLANIGNFENDEEFDMLYDNLAKLAEPQKDISTYLFENGGFKVGFLTNNAKNSAYIFISNPNIRIYHLLQSFIPRYFKHLFVDNPLTDLEKELVKSLTERTSTNYAATIFKIASQKDYRKQVIECEMEGFERHCRDRQLEEARRRLADLKRRIEQLANEQREAYSKYDEQNIRVEGITALQNKAGDSREIIDYFIGNKAVDLISAQNGVLIFNVRTMLDFYDVEGYASMSKNGDIYNSYDLSNGNVFRERENRKLLMDNLFSASPKIAIKMCAYFELNARGTANSQSGHDFGAAYQDYLPNPHFQRHNCLGNNEPEINNILMQGEMLAAVDQCISAARGVNVHETGATFRPMLHSVFESKDKIIRTIDGVDMTPEEALNWLKGDKE